MSSPRDELVAEVVVALTDTLSDGFDVADLLYTLTTACVELLDVDAAGVLLVDEQGLVVPVAATHGGSANLETAGYGSSRRRDAAPAPRTTASAVTRVSVRRASCGHAAMEAAAVAAPWWGRGQPWRSGLRALQAARATPSSIFSDPTEAAQ